jgi:proteasome accessory factor B
MPDQPAILRHWLLLRTLAARRQGGTLRELADEHGVNQKTIHRDLLLLQDLGFKLAYESGYRGLKRWKLDGSAGLAQLSFTLEEAAALYLGRQFLEPLAGTDFFRGAQSAFAKIRATLGDAPLRHLEKLAAAFYCKTHGLADYSKKGQLIDDLQRAAEDRRLTVIAYQSLRSTEAVTHYDVHPYALVWHNHALYLIAYSAGHGQVRTFKVDRLAAAEVQQLQFTRPADFEPQKHLADSFGIYTGDEKITVRARFTPTASRYLREKRMHASQTLTRDETGNTIAQWTVSSTVEIKSFLLSFGAAAEVLEPAELRQEMAAELNRAAELYGERPITSIDGHSNAKRPAKRPRAPKPQETRP